MHNRNTPRFVHLGIAVVLTVMAFSVAACDRSPSGTTGEPPAETPPEQVSPEPSTPPADPPPEVAQQVRDVIRTSVAGQLDASGRYVIPPRGGHEVSGTMGDFHAVHAVDDDTFVVCVDFHDGDSTYDVDFFVDHTPNGLSVARHFLHKIDGREVGREESP